jgi:hypothetical protein
MTRRYRPRKEFKFWLYHDLVEDMRLMEYIEFLVKTRQFATNVRNGLRLMWSLGQGDLSILFELFPTLRAQFVPDNSTLIEEFRQLLLQQSRAVQPETAPALSGPKLLAGAKQLPMPVLDDDQDTIVLKRNVSTDASANLFNAMLGLQQ